MRESCCLHCWHSQQGQQVSLWYCCHCDAEAIDVFLPENDTLELRIVSRFVQEVGHA